MQRMTRSEANAEIIYFDFYSSARYNYVLDGR